MGLYKAMIERTKNLKEGELIAKRKCLWEENKNVIEKSTKLENVYVLTEKAINFAFVLVKGITKD